MSQEMKVVSTCPRCGAPIYAQASQGESTPRTVYSCECRLQPTKAESTPKGFIKHGQVDQTPTMY